VDVHAHAVIPAALRFGGDPRAVAAAKREAELLGSDAVEVNRVMIERVAPLLTELPRRLAAMDGMGVDVQVVSPSPVHYHDWADEQLAAQISREVNEGIAALCAKSSDRLTGLGIAPLHHPALAAGELAYAIGTLGLRGVEIPTRAGDRELGDPELEPFWAAAEETGALVFIHPWGCTLGSRLDRHYLANVVGQPLETTVALSHIIFSGLLDRRPGLRIIAAHGGGYLPYYAGRSDHAWAVRPDSATPLRAPSEYLREIYYDSLVYEPLALQALIARAGADRVLLGTDYPFDMGVEDPLERLRSANLELEQFAAIAHGNAATLLGLGIAA
jgi:aminocarboxymuconate-semialdehyde decarboxylase